jgi:hypothetical protein
MFHSLFLVLLVVIFYVHLCDHKKKIKPLYA